MCAESWTLTPFLPQEAAVVPQMLARRVRHGLQLQLKRKEQINRMLRRGLIRTRKQLHLKKIRVAEPLNHLMRLAAALNLLRHLLVFTLPAEEVQAAE